MNDKTFDFAKNKKYDGYMRGHVSMIYKGFDKKSTTNKETGINCGYAVNN